MSRTLQKRSKLIAFTAFLQRAFARSQGIYKHPKFGIEIEERAKRYLVLLCKDEMSFAFKIALENLRRECDLFIDEAALVPAGLALQRKVVELADRYEIANQLVQEMFRPSPLGKLFRVILAEARNAGALEIQIDFNTNRESFPVLLKTEGGLTEIMRVPANLATPLRGVIVQFEGIGFAALAPYLQADSVWSKDLRFRWLDRHRLEIEIDPPGGN